MSISIKGPRELWGLISCHSYGQSGMRVSFPLRKMCRLIGDTVSRNIERLSYASRLQARKLINTAPTDANPSGYIIASSDDLLKLFEADYGALCIRDETKMLGEPTHSQEILALIEYLKMRQIDSVIASHNVTKVLLNLRYPPGFKHISGCSTCLYPLAERISSSSSAAATSRRSNGQVTHTTRKSWMATSYRARASRHGARQY